MQWWSAADPAAPDEFSMTVVGGDPLLVTFLGELDIVSADDAWSRLKKCTAPGTPVTVDLGGLVFIDSSGVLVLERLAHRLAGAVLSLVNPRPAAHRLLSLTGTAQRPNVRIGPPRADPRISPERAVASHH